MLGAGFCLWGDTRAPPHGRTQNCTQDHLRHRLFSNKRAPPTRLQGRRTLTGPDHTQNITYIYVLYYVCGPGTAPGPVTTILKQSLLICKRLSAAVTANKYYCRFKAWREDLREERGESMRLVLLKSHLKSRCIMCKQLESLSGSEASLKSKF